MEDSKKLEKQHQIEQDLLLAKEAIDRNYRALEQENRTLKAELDSTKALLSSLQKQFDNLRIVGPGFSGQGEKIQFEPTASADTGDGTGVSGDFDYFDGDSGTLMVATYINGLLDHVT